MANGTLGAGRRSRGRRPTLAELGALSTRTLPTQASDIARERAFGQQGSAMRLAHAASPSTAPRRTATARPRRSGARIKASFIRR